MGPTPGVKNVPLQLSGGGRKCASVQVDPYTFERRALKQLLEDENVKKLSLCQLMSRC